MSRRRRQQAHHESDDDQSEPDNSSQAGSEPDEDADATHSGDDEEWEDLEKAKNVSLSASKEEEGATCVLVVLGHDPSLHT